MSTNKGQSQDEQLSHVEKSCGIPQGSIGVDAQIETAQGLINVEEIAMAPRVCSIAFGPLDFMADLGTLSAQANQSGGYESANIFDYPLMKILVAARAAGIFALDGPVVDVHNLEKFKASAMRASLMGFDGKWVVHPSQIETCNDIFTPSQEVFDSASLLLQAYEFHTSSSGGAKGAVIYEGAMIDEASRKMALATQARGISAGLKPSNQFKP
jgi:citrate lyase subunit beta/citryl-CoA lyase